MARIPLYQQQQLASSLVGVPQSDDSGALIANNIARNTGALANTVLGREQAAYNASQIQEAQAFQNVGQAVAINRIYAKVAEQQQAKLQQESLVAANSVDLNYAIDDASIAAKQSHPDNPQLALKQYRDSTNSVAFDKFIKSKNITDDNIIAGLREKWQSAGVSGDKELSRYAFTQGNKIVDSKTKEALQTAVGRAGDSFDAKAIGDAFKNIDAVIPALLASQDAPTANALVNQAKKSALTNWFNQGINTDPKGVSSLLDPQSNDTYAEFIRTNLDSKERGALLDKAESKIKANQHDLDIAIDAKTGLVLNDMVDIELSVNTADKNPNTVLNAMEQVKSIVEQNPNNPKVAEKANSVLSRLNSFYNEGLSEEEKTANKLKQTTAENVKAQEDRKKVDRETKETIYKSPQGVETRSSMNALMTGLREDSQGKNIANIKSVTKANNKNQDAYQKGYLTQSEYEKNSGFIRSLFTANINKEPVPQGVMQMFSNLHDVPKTVMQGLNPNADKKSTDDVTVQWNGRLNATIKRFKNKAKRDPNNDDLIRMRPDIEMRMLLGQPEPEG